MIPIQSFENVSKSEYLKQRTCKYKGSETFGGLMKPPEETHDLYADLSARPACRERSSDCVFTSSIAVIVRVRTTRPLWKMDSKTLPHVI